MVEKLPSATRCVSPSLVFLAELSSFALVCTDMKGVLFVGSTAQRTFAVMFTKRPI